MIITTMENNQAVAVSEARRYLERHGGQAAPGGIEMIDLLNAFFPAWRSHDIGQPPQWLSAEQLGWHTGTTGE